MGWMLTWGNVMFVGFMFPLSVVFQYHNPSSLSIVGAIAIIALALFGLIVFSQANSQKSQFRSDPTQLIWGKTPESMPTKRGTKLLLSGWWGLARKMNYTGDLILALSHGLPSCSTAFVAHIYFVYLFALLMHRAQRDEELCKKK